MLHGFRKILDTSLACVACCRYYEMLQSWSGDNWSYDWDNKAPGMHVLLTQLFPSEMMPYAQNAKK